MGGRKNLNRKTANPRVRSAGAACKATSYKRNNEVASDGPRTSGRAWPTWGIYPNGIGSLRCKLEDVVRALRTCLPTDATQSGGYPRKRRVLSALQQLQNLLWQLVGLRHHGGAGLLQDLCA